MDVLAQYVAILSNAVTLVRARRWRAVVLLVSIYRGLMRDILRTVQLEAFAMTR